MLRTPRQQMAVDYLDATDNEIAVDQMFFGLAHTTSDQVGYFPRVSRWIGRAKKHPIFSKLLWRVLWCIWLGGGCVIFFVYELFRYEWLRKCATQLDGGGNFLSNGAVLAFSTRTCDVVSPERFSGLPTAWLICPWASQHNLPKDAEALMLMSFVERHDLFASFVDAVRASYSMARNQERSNWVLQSYTALRWFMVRRVVDRISGTLVMVEHFDRWAVLTDRSVQLACKQSMSKRLVLIQHGTFGGLSGRDQEVKFITLPARLTSVHELHAYNTKEEAVFRASVLSQNNTACAPLSVHYFKPLIDLQGPTKSLNPRVLFVGHPLCESFQVSVFRALQGFLVIDAFYKPHPKAPMSPAMAAVGWKTIDNAGQFPRVELLISYPSTLVIEYEGFGIHASTHPLDVETNALDEFIKQTLKMLVPIA